MRRAELAIRSFRRFTSEKIILVLARSQIAIDLCDVIRVTCPDALNDRHAGYYIKTSLHQILPTGSRYCYVDNDVFAVSHRASHIFSLHQAPVVFGLDAKTLDDFYVRRARRRVEIRDALFKHSGVEVASNWRIWNGGIYVFDKTAHAFLDTWHRYTQQVLSTVNWSDRDQAALIAAVWKHGLQNNTTLPPEFNWLHKLKRGLVVHPDGFRTKKGEEIAILQFPVTYGNPKYQSWSRVQAMIPPDVETVRAHAPIATVLSTRPRVQLQEVGGHAGSLRNIDVIWNGDWHGHVATALAEHLCANGYLARTIETGRISINAKTLKLRRSICVKSHSDGRYCLIDFNDSARLDKNPLLVEALGDERCRRILKGQYFEQEPHPAIGKVVPYTYYEKDPQLFQSLLPDLRTAVRTCDSLYFRGSGRAGRNKIIELLSDVVVHQEGRLDRRSYYYEASSARIGLAMPGYGNVCHREIEYFGMGVPVIMPLLRNRFYDPLVPDEHYIAVHANVHRQGAAYMASCIREVYNRVRHDEAMLARIANNAKLWYDHNVHFSRSASFTARLLGFRSVPGDCCH